MVPTENPEKPENQQKSIRLGVVVGDRSEFHKDPSRADRATIMFCMKGLKVVFNMCI